MPTTTLTTPVPATALPVGAPGTPRLRRTVSVETRSDAPETLVRVLGVLLRRGCRVARVDFAAADRRRPGRLLVAYDAPAAHADRAAAWLRGLVDVLSVEPLDP